jgi:hypothetical protein
MTQQAIAKGDSFQKMGGAGFIIGAVLITIGNIWVTSIDLSKPMEAQRKLSEQIVMFQAVVLLMTLGVWAVMIGAAGVYRSITASTASGAASARLGFYFMIMGTTLATLGMSLDTTYSVAIANWLAAPAAGKELAHNIVTIFSGTQGLGRGLFPMNVMSNWLAYTFLGVGMIRSAIYPRWLGWVGLILGMIGVPMGMIMTFTGREVIFNFFTVLAFSTILWWLMCGIWVARKAW